MNITQTPSPNFDSRNGQPVDMLVLHYTGMKSAQEAIDRLCDPASKVSAHYVVEENGTIHALVPEEHRAWHAGVSFWRGHSNINQRSIGIEIVNPGHEFGYPDFPKIQMQAVAALCKDILARHPIPERNVVAHSDIAPTRKLDPGEKFDWAYLWEQNVGLYPPIYVPAHPEMSDWIPAATKKLETFGYDITDISATITAFQRHFRQKTISGQWDGECDRLLQSLLDSVD